MKTSVIKNLISVLMENDKILLALISVSTLIFIVCALMAIILLMMIMMNYSNSQLVKNPLNKDTIAYQMRDACNINLTQISSNYPYGVIMWLLFINLLIIIGTVIYIFTGKEGSERVENNKKLFGSNKVVIVIVVLLFAGISVLLFGISSMFFSKTKNIINNANQNVAIFNTTVSTSMYTSSSKIFTELRKLPTNTIDITNSIANSLNIYFSENKEKIIKNTSGMDPIIKELSELFFTFNLYQHYIEMGIQQNNNAVSNALQSVFNTTNILKYEIGSAEAKTETNANTEIKDKSVFTDVDSSSWPAADYLINKYTFIQDYSNTYIDLIKNSDYYDNTIRNIITSKVLLNASNDAANKSIKASQEANSFNLNASLNSFISMAVWIAIITVLPFVLIWFILSGTAEGSMELLLQKEIDTNADKTIADSNTRLYEIQSQLNSIARKIKTDVNNAPPIQNGGLLLDIDIEKDKTESNLQKDIDELESITKDVVNITKNIVDTTKKLVEPIIQSNIQQTDKNTKRKNIDINIKQSEDAFKIIQNIFEAIENIVTSFQYVKENFKDFKDYQDTYNELIAQFNDTKNQYNNTFKFDINSIITQITKNIPEDKTHQNGEIDKPVVVSSENLIADGTPVLMKDVPPLLKKYIINTTLI